MIKKACEGCSSPFLTGDGRVAFCTECYRQQDAEGDDCEEWGAGCEE